MIAFGPPIRRRGAGALEGVMGAGAEAKGDAEYGLGAEPLGEAETTKGLTDRIGGSKGLDSE